MVTVRTANTQPPQQGPIGQRLRPIDLLIPFTIGLASIYSAEAVRILHYERDLFGLVVVVSAVLALGAVRAGIPTSAATLAGLWVAAATLYFVVSLLQPDWLVGYVVGDLALSLLPLLVMMALLAHPRRLQSKAALVLLTGMLLAASLCARVFGVEDHRHDPPSALLIAAVWYLALQAKSSLARLLCLPGVILVGGLCYSSGYRTHLILWAIAPIMIVAIFRGGRALPVAIISVTLLYLSVTLAGYGVNLASSLNDSRFQAILAGHEDVSLETRFAEVHDVLNTADAEWLPGQEVLGYGYGASYNPQLSYIASNVGSDGRVHSIHTGPVMVYFRYGWLGIIIFSSMLVSAFRLLRRLPGSSTNTYDRDSVAICGFSLLLFSAEFLTLNATVEPAMSYCLGTILAARALTSTHPQIKRSVAFTRSPTPPSRP